MRRLFGITTPVLTPFTEDGAVDYPALRGLCDFLVDGGVHCLYLLGTTAEVMLLSVEERRRIAEEVLTHVGGRVPVYVQVGAMPTGVATGLARHAEAAGADGVGLLTPYYHTLRQDDLAAYVREVRRGVAEDFPIYLYNLPACTTNDLLPATVRELARLDNVVGIKNSMADMHRLLDLLEIDPGGFDVLQGADLLLLNGLGAGAKGGVSGTSNAWPELFAELYDAAATGDWARAQKLQEQVNQVVRVLKDGAEPGYFKAAVQLRGLPPSFCRRPLHQPDPAELADLRAKLADIGFPLADPAA